MGELLTPRGWCRQRWCRAEAAAEHFDGDGCSCHSQDLEEGQAGNDAAAAGPEISAALPSSGFDDRPTPEPRLAASEPRLTILTTRAARLSAFACRACGTNTRRMIEAPVMFFRCEECARADRWPPSTSSRRPA